MELRHMRHFLAVAEERHFGRAAERLNMAQPPLSQSIQRLEAGLGVRLLERSRRGVFLTTAGEVFLEEARRTVMQADLARAVTLRAADARALQVNIAFTAPALFRFLPPLLLQHRRRHENVELRLFHERTPEQIAGILAGRFDVAFTQPCVELVEGGDHLTVERCRYIAAVPETWPIARKTSVTLAELGAHPMIITRTEPEWPSRLSAMLAAFRDVGVSPKIAQESMQTFTTLTLVAAGMGFAMTMETSALTGLKGVAFREVSDLPPTLNWEVAMIWRPQHLSAAARDFVAAVKDYRAKHPEMLDPGATLLA
jgi:DNA-binding transcriptional LysR family regulator